MRLGILGGTFDPIHIGHLIVAEEARLRLELDRVILIPTGRPWLKDEQPLATPEHRSAMVELGIASNPSFAAGRHEVDRGGPTYTVDTMEVLRREQDPSDSLHFILGLDALGQFDRWKSPERILELCDLGIVNRPGFQNTTTLDDQLARFPQMGAKTTLVNVSRIDISSTEIRERAARGSSFKYLTPESVEAYIHEHGLYRS